MQNSLFSSKSNEWETPDDLFNRLDSEFHFTLDPCSTHKNAKCKKHYTIKEDGLSKSWDGETVFVNPPYGRQVGKWVKKCYESKATVVALLAARTDTKWFHKYIYNGCDKYCFIEGRIWFKGAKYPAPFPSMIVVWRNK